MFESLWMVWLLMVVVIVVVKCFWCVSLISEASHPCIPFGMHFVRMVCALRLWSSGSRPICCTVCDDLVSRALDVVLVALCPKFMCAPRSRQLFTTLIVVSLYFHLCALSFLRACLVDAKIRLFGVATRAPMSCRNVCVCVWYLWL